MRQWLGARPGAGAKAAIKEWLWIGGLALAWLLPVAGLRAAPSDLKPFFGTYVGVATVEETKTGEIGQRDMDIVIQPYHEDGFRIDWINVSLVDGRRDLPGVERRVQSALFEPVAGRDMYVEVEAENLFREREETRPMRGDPVRWASIDGPRMHVYAFMVLEDGTYELQIYDRVLTENGLDIEFQRLVDGELLRRISGSSARAQ